MINFEYTTKEYKTIKRYEQILIEYLSRLYSTGLTSEDYFNINTVIKSLYESIKDAYKDFTTESLYESLRGIAKNPSKYGSRTERRLKKRYYNSGPYCWSEEEKKQYRLDRDNMKRYTKELNKLLYEYRRLYILLKEKLIGYTIEEFVEREASLTHLAFANNHLVRVRPHSKNSFMFLCPMHLERTPSFSVDNMNRSGHCYGCGKTVRPISFIKKVELLSDQDAINLLANIYNLDIPRTSSDENEELLDKYRSSLISPEFKELLINGRERTAKYRHTAKVLLALDTYDRDLQTIERVKNSEPLPYTDPETLDKRLVLEPPFSH